MKLILENFRQYLDADEPPKMLGNTAGLAGSGATGSVPPTGTDVGEPTYLSQEVN